MAHIRHSRPDSGLLFQDEVLKAFHVVLLRSESISKCIGGPRLPKAGITASSLEYILTASLFGWKVESVLASCFMVVALPLSPSDFVSAVCHSGEGCKGILAVSNTPSALQALLLLAVTGLFGTCLPNLIWAKVRTLSGFQD